MLIQDLGDRLRLIPQHEHGLQSGELAAAWVGPGGDETVSEVVVLAAALHDLAWRQLDREPFLDPGSGLPVSFVDFPARPKYEAASAALDRLEEMHPYAAVLVSLHYTSFGSPGRPSAFEESEEERRLELLDGLGDEAPGPRAIRRDLEHLRLFDNLSLFLCLTPPGASERYRPEWLRPDLLATREGGPRLSLTWVGGEAAALEPFPFDSSPLEVPVECRDLPAGPFASDEALLEAWEEAGPHPWTVKIVSS
ncbi:MAG: DUF3891 family protein [Gemmatimonadetes bacterium]|nr:DUF3891 family protein [Gemmatimonadota bacterium]NIR80775.1 DUF3891 family protein [Gemmatimonadota bacterium]NIT90295.1 DUF3891 family protein [Gemmatimonadota bacterium]NIU33375.1 DUF3891 family protein [Gemmatimonadota bacterium]NIU37664.1 DUF3891 family protein [Gemmatimonadota bacterium]